MQRSRPRACFTQRFALLPPLLTPWPLRTGQNIRKLEKDGLIFKKPTKASPGSFNPRPC